MSENGDRPDRIVAAVWHDRIGEDLAAAPTARDFCDFLNGETPETINAITAASEGGSPKFARFDPWMFELLHDVWKATPEADRGPHPIEGLLKGYRDRPDRVAIERRRDKRIFPVARITEGRPERKRGQLFAGMGERHDVPGLPLFDEPAQPKRVPLLDVVDAAGVPIRAAAQGAALEARLFVHAALAVRQQDYRRECVRMAVTVRELREGLFPNRWSAGRDWPRLKAALKAARDYWIVMPDGGQWSLLALRELPAENAKGLPDLDAHVTLDLAMPPGVASGPEIDLAHLQQLSVEDAGRFRAYIAAHAVNWLPGRTRRPAPKAGQGQHRWSADPQDYPVLTESDRRRLAFGASDTKHRTKAEIAGKWQDVEGLTLVAEKAVDPRTGEVGYRYMPKEAVGKSDD